MYNPNKPRLMEKAGGKVATLAFISFIALGACSSEGGPEIAQATQGSVSEVGLTTAQDSISNVVETTTTLPEEPDFVESLPPEVKKETLELWLRESDVSDFCTNSVQLMVQKSDLQSTYLSLAVDRLGPRIPDRNISQPDSLVAADLCLDPKSFVFDDGKISANMTTNPEIHNEGQEGQPDIFITLRADDTIGYCIEAREEMKDLLKEKVAEIGETLELDTDYKVEVRVSPGSDYSESIIHPCDDTAISTEQ